MFNPRVFGSEAPRLSSRVNQTLCDLKDVHGISAKSYAKMSGVPQPIPPPIPVRSARTPSPHKSPMQRRTNTPPRSGSLRSLGSARSGRSPTSALSAPSTVGVHAFDFFEALGCLGSRSLPGG